MTTEQTLLKWLQPTCSLVANVYTMRITPYMKYKNDEIKDLLMKICQDRHEVEQMFCYREGVEDNKNTHYHIRWEFKENYVKSRNTLDKIIKEYFPTFLGNKNYSIKPCFIGGKLVQKNQLWKSKTYVAKEGDLICYYGISPSELATISQIGYQLQQQSILPIYRKILMEKNITGSTNIKTIVDKVFEWYDQNNKPIPQKYQVINLVNNIKFRVDKKYLENWKHRLISEITYNM